MKSFDSLVGSAARKAMHDDRRIKQVISRIVPTSAVDHLLFCRLEDERLRITVTTAAWVARLRFQERQIIDILRHERFQLNAISWHVAPAETPQMRKTIRQANPVTEQAAAMLQSTAEGADDDRLQAALQRLSTTLSASTFPEK